MGIVVDTVNNELYVANVYGLTVTVYSRTASNFTAPIRILGPAGATGLNNPAGIALSVSTTQVSIDIKPGGLPNSINLRNRGVVPVAILTTGTFDATAVDPGTVRFGATGTEAAPVHAALEDVDGDGDIDLILQFNTQDTGIVCGAVSASLTGQTFGGQAIGGGDFIKTTGCH